METLSTRARHARALGSAAVPGRGGEEKRSGRRENRAMTDRRMLGSGPRPADDTRPADTELPRALLAAERIDPQATQATQAAPTPAPVRPTGRRTLGTGSDPGTAL